MNKEHRTYAPMQRLLAFALAFVMVLGYVPNLALTAHADSNAPITTVNDPYVEVNSLDTLIYGNNTKNAGKVTVDKNVIDDNESINLPNVGTLTPSTDNFLVQVSQSAQVMALSREIPVPIDAVFVLDTSGSMNEGANKPDRASSLVAAANNAIAALMEANPDNRVGVVAFSSEDYGRGTSAFQAANVLSDLEHYTGEEASGHLQLTEIDGVPYLLGRNTVSGQYTWYEYDNKMYTQQVQNNNQRPGQNNQQRVQKSYTGTYAARDAHNGGTNIQAGIALGAQMLTSVPENDTMVTYGTGVNARTVTRMPVLIIVSDGCPTFSPSDTTWYDPATNGEVGPGNAPYEGEAFLTALTAAYYKGKISEWYYGTEASADQRCSVYTVGVDITTNNGYMDADEMAQAEFALDPAKNAVSGTNYYSYGNSWDADLWNRETDYAPATYWNSYNWATARNFDVRVNNNQFYTVTAASINATRNYVNGISSKGAQMYSGGIGYNDEYYSASNNDLVDKFAEMIMKIQLKAISTPTQIEEAGEDFSGYVTFIDPIGEFMEVKDMKGIYANGQFYQGNDAAQLLEDKDSELLAVLNTRLNLTQSTGVTASDLIANPQGNSIVWWGNAYSSDGTALEDKVQCLGPAADDSIACIKSATDIPNGADVVVRSYFFTADGTNKEYLYFVVRVMRSLSAPYQQTVTVSAPASLLSVDKVLVNEKTDGTHTVALEDEDVARVIYEVGLRSDINAGNVAAVVAEEMPGYANETVTGEGSANYTESTKTYHFFTNDWDRTKSGDNHHRAMSQAIFEAAGDNDFYIYQEDTPLVDANGNPVTAVSGQMYIQRDVYTWNPNASTNSDGTYNATKDTVKIPVSVTAGSSVLVQKDGYWYIKKGTHAESTLASIDVEDTPKSNNTTGTAYVVRHPHNSGATTPHYTVLLGNNGKLSLAYEAPKTVDIIKENGTTMTDADGKPVMVGETLKYNIKVINSESTAATAVVTDYVPAGTEFVFADNGGTLKTDSNNKQYVEWTLPMSAGETRTVSFQVKVTEDAVSTTEQIGDIQNTATIQIGNNPSYTTNTTENPPEGKTVTDGSGADLQIPTDSTQPNVKVGDELTYHIQWANDAVDENGAPAAATVTITDKIPAGTTFHSFTGNQTGTYDQEKKTLTWTINAAPGATGYVSFKVTVNAEAVTENKITNTATIKIGENDPGQTTNPVTVTRDTGNMSVKKLTVLGNGLNGKVDLPTNATFTFRFTESTGTLNGKFAYTVTNGETSASKEVEFTNGTATISGVKANDVITITGLPLGAKIAVGEAQQDSWVMNCTCNNQGTSTAAEETFVDVDTLVEITPTSGNADAVDLTITNCYHPTPAHFQLKGTKNYLGSIANNTNFTFTATQVRSDENDNLVVNEQGEVVVLENGGSATATVTYTTDETSDTFLMTGREFYEPTTNYYLIKETAIAGTTMIMAENQYLLKLVVSENAAGKLEANAWIATKGENGWTDVTWTDANKFNWATDITTVSFTNIAPTPSDAVVISGTKNLTGRDIKDNEFGFALYEVVTTGEGESATETETLVQTVNLGSAGIGEDGTSGTFAFNLTYDVNDMIVGGVTQTAREFKYRVKEIQGTDKDITYATNFYDVTVTVTLNQNTGKLEASVSDLPEGGIVFNNKYNGETSLTLTGTKTFYNYAKDGSNHQFSFTVQDEAGNEVSGASVTITGEPGTETYTSGITFAPIYFTNADMLDSETGEYVNRKVFEYTVKEIAPVAGDLNYDPNIKYSPAEYKIEVTVTYDTDTGAMSAAVTNRTETSAVMANNETNLTAGYDFNNIKNPASIQTVVGATKNISGMHVPEGLRFSFDLVGVTIAENGAITRGNVQATGTSVATIGGEGTIVTPLTPASTALDEPTDTTEESKPTDTTEESKPTDTTEESKPADTTEESKPADTTEESKPADTTEESNPTDTTEESKPADTTEESNPTDTTEESKPVATSTGSDLIRSSASGVPGEPIVVSETQNIPYTETKAVTFTPLTFYEAGTYWYIMEESNTSAQNGVGYDKTKYLVEVVVGYDTNGKFTVMNTLYYLLTAGQEGTNKSHFDTNHTVPVFNNTYNADVALNLTATKVLTGRDLNENEFDFVLERLNSGGTGVGSINGTHGSASAGNPATITFASLNYSSDAMAQMATKHTDGSYYIHYVMREIKPSSAYLPGITYDVSQYLVTIKVTVPEEADGKMTAVLHRVTAISNTDNIQTLMNNAEEGESVGGTNIGEVKEDSAATFTNSYSVTTGTSATLEVTKTLTGRDIKEGEFSFILERQDKDAEGNPVWKQVGTTTNTKVDANSGKVTFTRNFTADTLSHLAFDEEFPVVYRITEVTPKAPGVTEENPDAEIYAKVIIVHTEGSASYSIAEGYPEYYSDESCKTKITAENLKFVNKYTPTSITYAPEVQKQLFVGNTTETKAFADGKFVFNLYELTETGDAYTEGTTAISSTSNVGTTATFTNLTYNASDMEGAEGTKDFYYVIKEAPGTDPTITYSTQKIYLKVTVTDNTETGALSVNAAYYSDNSFADDKKLDTPTFTNHYGPGEVDVELQLKKQVVMKDAAGNELSTQYPIQESEFDVTAVSQTVEGVTIPGTTAAGNGTAVINLGTRTFTREMLYENGTIVPGKSTSKEFVYEVSEDKPSETGAFTYDEEKITVKVTITDDGYGNLTASEPTFSKSNGEEAAITGDGANTFVNIYTYKASTPLTLHAKKVLNNKSLAENEFSFTLTGDNNVSQTKQNAADGTVTFDEITFNAPGEYTYTIAEKAEEGKTNYTYDNTAYTVVVKVESDVAGNLIATPTYYVGSGEGVVKPENVVAAPVVFTNSYKPSPITADLSAAIGATKEITGADNLPLSGFQFKVTDSSGNAVIGKDGKEIVGTSTEVEEDGKKIGKIIFNDQFQFNASGVYHYYITENGNYPGYTTDPATWSVYVTVSYNMGPDDVTYEQGGVDMTAKPGELYISDSNISAQKQANIIQTQETEVQPQGNVKPVFTNLYNPDPTSVTITANKVFKNAGEKGAQRELKGGEFKFYLMNDKMIAAEAHNDANGNVTFTVNYTAQDMSGATMNDEGKLQRTFTYTVKEEKPGSMEYIGFDEDTVTFEVTLTTDDNGALITNAPTTSVKTFTNTYKADPVTAQITATKSLAGLKLDNLHFHFNLIEGQLQKDADGKVTVVNAEGEPIDPAKAEPVDTANNDASGNVTFNVDYTLDDLGGALSKTFHYVLYEVAGNTEGMTYDTTLHPVSVTVTDDQKGTLSAEVTYGENGQGTAPIIYNTYKGDSQFVTLEAVKALSAPTSKTMTLASKALNGKFAFELLTRDADGNETILETVTNQAKLDDKGNVVDYSVVKFSSLEYKEAGTHTYYIREVKGDMAGMTYDTAERKVVVTVTQNLDDGQYDVTVDYANGDANAKKTTIGDITYIGAAPTITNTYKMDAVKVTLEATKKLTGRTLKNGEFTFQVHDSNGTLVAKATNDKDGKIVLSDIKLPVAGTYKLTISEVRGRALFMTYDKHTYTVTVEVSETGGVLKVDQITYPVEKITFKNIYDPSAPSATGDQMPLVLMLSVMAASAAAIVVLLVARKKRKTR